MGFVADIFGGIFGAQAAGDAADAQAQGYTEAIEYLNKLWKKASGKLDPFVSAATRHIPIQENALRRYLSMAAAGPGVFEKSPYYKTLQSSIDEAANALSRRGLVTGAGSGPTGKALMRYAVPIAAETRGNWLNEWQQRMQPFGVVGEAGSNPNFNALGIYADLAGRHGGQIANMFTGRGEAEASGYLGVNAVRQGLFNKAGNLLDMGVSMIGGGGGGMGSMMGGSGGSGGWFAGSSGYKYPSVWGNNPYF